MVEQPKYHGKLGKQSPDFEFDRLPLHAELAQQIDELLAQLYVQQIVVVLDAYADVLALRQGLPLLFFEHLDLAAEEVAERQLAHGLGRAVLPYLLVQHLQRASKDEHYFVKA